MSRFTTMHVSFVCAVLCKVKTTIFLPSDDTFERNFPGQMMILNPLVFIFQYFQFELENSPNSTN